MGIICYVWAHPVLLLRPWQIRKDAGGVALKLSKGLAAVSRIRAIAGKTAGARTAWRARHGSPAIRRVCDQLTRQALLRHGTDPDMIDAAIYTMRACECRLSYLFGLMGHTSSQVSSSRRFSKTVLTRRRAGVKIYLPPASRGARDAASSRGCSLKTKRRGAFEVDCKGFLRATESKSATTRKRIAKIFLEFDPGSDERWRRANTQVERVVLKGTGGIT